MVPVAMLLLDHNLPHQLRDLLAAYGLEGKTAVSRGWERLRNGELVTAAHAAWLRHDVHSRLEVRRIRIEVIKGSSNDGARRDQAAST